MLAIRSHIVSWHEFPEVCPGRYSESDQRPDAHGACTFNQHGDHRIHNAAKVKSYPVSERDGIVWMRMGASGSVAQTPVPDLTEFFWHGQMPLIADEYVVNAHFECVLDNLLHLSHAPFLHPNPLADPDSVQSLRVEMKQEDNTVWAYHYASNTDATPQFNPFRQPSVEPKTDFHAHMRWDPPANLQLDVGITELGRSESEGLYLDMANFLTPIDESPRTTRGSRRAI